MCLARKVRFWDIKQYLLIHGQETGPHYLTAVTHPRMAQALLDPQRYQHYQGYGLFVGAEMVGYAVIKETESLLSLMHISPSYRSQGLGEQFLHQLNVNETIVNRDNHGAIKFYERLGIAYTFDDE